MIGSNDTNVHIAAIGSLAGNFAAQNSDLPVILATIFHITNPGASALAAGLVQLAICWLVKHQPSAAPAIAAVASTASAAAMEVTQ